MSTPAGEDAVRRTVTVPAAARRAFVVFTDGLATWWPREFTWSGEVLDTIGIEPGPDGLCYERGPHGFTVHWGRVLAWEPPDRLLLTWQISPRRVPEPDPSRASEVEVRFVAEGPERTRVELEHRGFARHGEEADAYRRGMEAGWDQLIDRYAIATEGGERAEVPGR
jgi:uncharacterized protein YndB with AHSA1/START domain